MSDALSPPWQRLRWGLFPPEFCSYQYQESRGRMYSSPNVHLYHVNNGGHYEADRSRFIKVGWS